MAKRRKPNGPVDPISQPDAEAPDAAGGNVTDETRRDFYERAIAARRDLEEAQKVVTAKNGVFRNILKNAKKAGCSDVAINQIIQWHKRDPEELSREIAEINRMAMLANLPLNSQLGLFPDGESVATKLDKQAAPVAGKQRDDVEFDGIEAGKAGKSATDNPYPDGSPGFLMWEKGRREANLELAQQTFGADAEPQPAA